MNTLVVNGIIGSFEEGVIVDGELWYVAVPRAWLCKMNLSTYQAQVVSVIPFVDEELPYSYNAVVVYDNRIILMPKYADNVLIYHIITGEFEKIKLKKSLETSGTEAGTALKFRSYAKDGDILWMMPHACHCIVEYNVVTGELVEHADWYRQFETYNWANLDLFGKGILAEESLWIPCYQLNAILEFSTQTKKTKLHYIGDKDDCYVAISYLKGEMWLFNCIKNLVCRWDQKRNIILSSISLPEEYKVEDALDSEEAIKYKVSYMYVSDNKIILIPAAANQFLCLDIANHRIRTLSMKDEGCSFVAACVLDSNRILCPSQNREQVVTIFLCEDKLERATLYVEVETNKVCIDGVISEELIDLNRSINIIKKWQSDRLYQKREYNVGVKIYNELNYY